MVGAGTDDFAAGFGASGRVVLLAINDRPSDTFSAGDVGSVMRCAIERAAHSPNAAIG